MPGADAGGLCTSARETSTGAPAAPRIVHDAVHGAAPPMTHVPDTPLPPAPPPRMSSGAQTVTVLS